MADRSLSRRMQRGFAVGVELALFTPRDGELGVLLRTTGDERSRSRLALPFATLSANETPDQCATDLVKAAASPAVVEQVGTFGAARQSPASGPKITILYFGLLAARTAFRPNYTWVDVN